MADYDSFMGGVAGGATVAIVITAVDNFSKQLEKADTGVKKLSLSLKASAAAVAGFFALGVKSAADQEKAEIKLSNALKNTNNLRTDSLDILRQQADAIQRLTGYEDDEILNADSLLARYKLNTDQIQRMIPALVDVSAAMQRSGAESADLASLTTAIGKAVNGNIGILARYGIVLDDNQKKQLENADATERVAILTKLLSDRYGGQAAQNAESFAGKLTILKRSFSEFAESVAKSGLMDFLKGVVDKLQDVVDWFNKLSPDMKKLILEVGGGIVAAGAVAKFTGLGKTVTEKAGEALGLGSKGSSITNPLFVWSVNGGLGSTAATAAGGAAAGAGIGLLGTVGLTVATIVAGSIAVKEGGELFDKATGGNYAKLQDAVKELGYQVGDAIVMARKEQGEELYNMMLGVNGQTQSSIVSKKQNPAFPLIDALYPKTEQVTNMQQKVNLSSDEHNLTLEQNTALMEYIDILKEQKMAQEEVKRSLEEGNIIEFEANLITDHHKLTVQRAAEELANFNINLDDFTTKIDSAVNSMGGTPSKKKEVRTGTYGYGIPGLPEGGEMIPGKVYGTPGHEYGVDLTTNPDGTHSENKDAKGYKDFISRPGFGFANFSPDDTIIGVKDTSQLGGNVVNVSIDNVYGTDPNQIATALQQKLSNMITI